MLRQPAIRAGCALALAVVRHASVPQGPGAVLMRTATWLPPVPAQEIAMPLFWSHRLPRRALPCPPRAEAERHPQPAPPLAQILELDARTDWPTHRIRSFLGMQDAPGRPSGR